ncbi:MAG: altronate dehydratase [Lachnospiraceae bacterium]|nr:altronate dehydratase [Lachnospiraceae bacterium]
MNEINLYRIHEADNVAIVLGEAKAGDTVVLGDDRFTVRHDIPFGHKVALLDIPKGGAVIKYGNRTGITACDIQKGDWLHDHNILSEADNHRQYTYEPVQDAVYPGKSDATFLGYRRKSGKVGTRNYIILISGSFCTNTHMKDFAEMASKRFPKTEHFDGFLPLTHECGCGQMGEDIENVRRILGRFIGNANFGGVFFVELGCENSLYGTVEPFVRDLDPDRFEIIRMQQSDDEFEEAMEKLGRLYEKVNADRRTPCSLSDLHIAANCGGSDAFSGITGNCLMGRLADHLVGEHGATINITEVPEMFGAEHILMNRARNRETFEKVVGLIDGFKNYIEKYGASASGNPSQGNRKGGISTIEEKALGSIQKGGNCAVMDVIPYGEQAMEHGFNLVWGPGSDLVGVTAQIAAGATMVIFITGRGTPVAYAAPTFKIATNNAIYGKKTGWMDFNAGTLLNGDDLAKLEEELYRQVIELAEGKRTASNERMGYYQIALLRDGVTL